MNKFSLNNLASRKQGSVVAPNASRFDAMSEKRREGQCEVMRTTTTTDPTGGQSEIPRLVGQYTVYIQDVQTPNEVRIIEGGADVQSTSGYEVSFPAHADVLPGDRLGIPGWLNAWSPEKEYNVGDRAITTDQAGNGHWYEVIVGGISAATEPIWPTESGKGVVDATVLWREGGFASYLEVIGDNRSAAPRTELVCLCREIR